MRGRGRRRAGKLTQQVETLRREFRTANTGAYSRKTACVRLPNWDLEAKMFYWNHQMHRATNEARRLGDRSHGRGYHEALEPDLSMS